VSSKSNFLHQDLFFDMGFLFDSVEPSVSWSKCWSLINAIRGVWGEEVGKRNVFNILALRISQVYNDGVCVYFYYGIGPTKERDQLETFEELTDILRRVILASGGNLVRENKETVSVTAQLTKFCSHCSRTTMAWAKRARNGTRHLCRGSASTCFTPSRAKSIPTTCLTPEI
jgi:hypothetical protein